MQTCGKFRPKTAIIAIEDEHTRAAELDNPDPANIYILWSSFQKVPTISCYNDYTMVRLIMVIGKGNVMWPK